MKVPLSEIATMVAGNIVGDSNKLISGAAPFDEAGDGEITVASNVQFLKQIDESAAGAILVPRGIQSEGRTLIQVDIPMVAFAKVLQYFHPRQVPQDGIHPRSEIGKDFSCGINVSIGPLVVIGNQVSLGDRAWVHPGVFIGDRVTIGNDVTIYPNVTILERCTIGHRVIIHSGTVIGSDGFGFAPDGQTYHKIPHTGIVQIDDDVEIGANNAIDRGTFGKTVICRGVKTDNLVHVAHNVTVGENTVLVAQVGISGSTTIGKNAVLAGQAGVAGHLSIGDSVTIGPQTGIGKSVPDGQTLMSGLPEMPYKLWLRVQRLIPKLPEFSKRLSSLEKSLQEMDKNGKRV
jgi:UDP-3-O-[3-hydroxymyristoyl] glucosamine N-acyltransferase